MDPHHLPGVGGSVPNLHQTVPMQQHLHVTNSLASTYPYTVASLQGVSQHQSNPMAMYMNAAAMNSGMQTNPALYQHPLPHAQYQMPPLSQSLPVSTSMNFTSQSTSASVAPQTGYALPQLDAASSCGNYTQGSSTSAAVVTNSLPNYTGNYSSPLALPMHQSAPQQSDTKLANQDISHAVPEGNTQTNTPIQDNQINTSSSVSNSSGALDQIEHPSLDIKVECIDEDNGQDGYNTDYDADTDIEDSGEKGEVEADVGVSEGEREISVSRPYMCQLCNETFTLKKQLQKHKMLPCKKMVYRKNSCDFCRRNFTRSDHVTRHIRTVHAAKFKMWQALQMKRKEQRQRQTKKGRIREEMKTRTCPYCLKVFRCIDEKEIHIRHHVGDEVPYLCTLCQAKFAEESQLKLHRRTRCGKNAFKCRMCDFAAISNRVMERHEMTHTGEKPYKCETCGKGFMSKTTYKCHQYVHTGEKPYPCEECDRAFTTSEHLKRHQMIHTGEKPFKCQTCPAAFNQNSSLIAHECSHKDVKPLICQVCGLSFITSSNLKQHLRTHAGEKNYPCKFCQRPFGRTDTLKKHERTHTGEKPFVCKECGTAYSRADKLNQHMKGHTGQQGEPQSTSTPKKKKAKKAENPEPPPAPQPSQPAAGEVTDETYAGANDLMAYAYRLACDYSTSTAENGQIGQEGNMPPQCVEEDPVIKEKQQEFVREYCKAMDESLKTNLSQEGDISVVDTSVVDTSVVDTSLSVVDSSVVNTSSEINTSHEDESTTALPDPIAPISIKKELEDQQQQHAPLEHSSTTELDDSSLCKIEDNGQNDGTYPHGLGKKIRHTCEICKKKFSSKHALQRHKKNLHKSDDKPYRCCDCQEDFATQALFEEHQKLHKFGCMLCPRTFTTELSLRKHQEKHKNQKVHICNTCNKAFVRKDHLKIHEKRHFANKGSLKHVECQYCCMAFLNKQDAITHESCSHDATEEKPYLCLICREQFSTMALLITHKYLHRGQKPFNCNMCNRSFRFHSALLVHSKSHNADGQREFKCDICDQKFSNQSHVKRHMLTHSGEKSYICKVCNTAFTESLALKTHLRTHAECRDYVCDTCGSAFKSSSNLQAHQRKHLGLKEHECSYCQKKFARPDTLKNHERIHRGEKPFVCSICGVAFTRKDKMKAHEKRHDNHPNGVIPIVRKKKVDVPQVSLQTSSPSLAIAASASLTLAPTVSVASSISTPAPLVTATIISTGLASTTAHQPVTASPSMPAVSYPMKTSMPPPASSPHPSAYSQHIAATLPQPQSHHSHHHLYSSATSMFPTTTSKHMVMPSSPAPYHMAASPHVYSHTASPHVYHPAPSPHPHYPSPAPSPHPYPQVSAPMSGYFAADANQAVSYHATPLFPTAQPAQAYQITHTSVMHL